MADKQIFIRDLVEGQQVNDLFMLARKTLGETRAGKPYLALTLMDRTGEIEARAWERAEELDGVAGVGDLLRVQARVTSYQEKLQFSVSGLQKVEPSADELRAFMPSSRRPVAEMREELRRRISGIQDPGLRSLLEGLFSGSLLEQFCLAPAAKKMHHAWLGGLIEHTLSVAGLAEAVAGQYPQLDRDLLLAGALVHDVAKTREFSYRSPPFEYTDQGRLLGHLVLGAEMVREAAEKVKGVPPARLDLLIHLILSHHGRHDFGAPVLPMTQEAILLHHLDDMDAKMSYIDQLRREQDEPGWSGFQRPLERFLYLRPLKEHEEDHSSPDAEPVPTGKQGKGVDKPSGSVRQPSLFPTG